MRSGLIAVLVLVLLAGAVVVVMSRGPGGRRADPVAGPGEPINATPSDRALQMVRKEIARAGTTRTDQPIDWLLDARAWVAAHRDPGWPYTELEAHALADILAATNGQPVSMRSVMRRSERQIDHLKSLDADGDGAVSDDEVAAYAEFHATMADPRQHPYLIDRLDTNGDGVLGPEETTWMDADAQVMRQQALAERARIDMWDTDNDGAISEPERAAGHAASLLRAQIFPDGHIEYVPDPDPAAADAQAATREAFAAEFGQDALDMTLGRQELAAEMYLTIDLGRELELIKPDTSVPWEPGPPMPDPGSFDRDSDGSLDEYELAASMTAMEAWERATHLNIATQTAERLRAMFDAQREVADTDYDGLILPEEWALYRERLLVERDARLFDRHYDLNGSGRVEPTELEVFVGWYRAGSLRADVNYDGSVDVLDLEDIAARYQAQGR